MVSVKLFHTAWVGIALFSVGTYGKSYLSIVSPNDQRGAHCQIERVSPEPNVMGIVIKCKEEVKIRGELGHYKEFSLVWPQFEGVDDNTIQVAIIKELNNGKALEETDYWLTTKYGFSVNPRSFSSGVPVVNFIKLSVSNVENGTKEYEITHEEMSKLLDMKYSDSDD